MMLTLNKCWLTKLAQKCINFFLTWTTVIQTAATEIRLVWHLAVNSTYPKTHAYNTSPKGLRSVIHYMILKITVTCNLGGMWMEAVSQYFTEVLKTMWPLNHASFPTNVSTVELPNTSLLLHKTQKGKCKQKVIHLIQKCDLASTYQLNDILYMVFYLRIIPSHSHTKTGHLLYLHHDFHQSCYYAPSFL
jgi:hypothetical protein